MLTIACPICEKDHTRLLQQRRERGLRLNTVVCLGCGLAYHNPAVEDQDRQKLEISPGQWHTGAGINPRQRRKLTRRWDGQWPLIEPIFRPGLKVLEVGCSWGLALHHLQEMGAQVLGVEPDPEQAAHAQRQGDLEIIQSRFEDLDLPGKKFDLILASHVIEHFPQPLAFLRGARELAHPGTRLLLETPNILAPKVSPRRVFSLAHNFYFSPQTLKWLLLKAGWHLETLRVWRRDAFQILARAGEPETPIIPAGAAQEVIRAIARHQYHYYLKMLFIWRKIPWWQKYWMYTLDPRYGR
ncbi:MAG: class I SAM-dependent methyltransferase [Deltaproteobacteria bacterium]|nr:class I SAM-dependent methyltransferase [Deltaproteobacteria bacterium]